MNFIENLFCNNVAVFIYLCAVHLKRTIWYKQVTAVLLLLILSSVTVTQLSHSHTSAATQKKVVVKKTDLPGFYTSGAENKCFICEYQLTKDADINHAVFNIDTPFHYPVSSAVLYSFTYPGICSFIETRGPPSVI